MEKLKDIISKYKNKLLISSIILVSFVLVICVYLLVFDKGISFGGVFKGTWSALCPEGFDWSSDINKCIKWKDATPVYSYSGETCTCYKKGSVSGSCTCGIGGTPSQNGTCTSNGDSAICSCPSGYDTVNSTCKQESSSTKQASCNANGLCNCPTGYATSIACSRHISDYKCDEGWTRSDKECYMTADTKCTNGMYVVNGECNTICPANSYCSNGVKYSCPSWSTSPEGSKSLDDCNCNIGHTKSEDKKTCVPNTTCTTDNDCPTHSNKSARCRNGTCTLTSDCLNHNTKGSCESTGCYWRTDSSGNSGCFSRPTESTTTDTCSSGKYLSNNQCNDCPKGQYCTGGTSYPQNCPTGYTTSGTGKASVSDCSVCDTVNGYKMNSSGVCTINGEDDTCEKGTYKLNGSCKTCLAGYYCLGGSYRMIKCTAGSYCPAGTGSPIKCPSGNFCPSGVASPESCGSGMTSPAGSTTESQCTKVSNGNTDNDKKDDDNKTKTCTYYYPSNCMNTTHYLCTQGTDGCYYTNKALGCVNGYKENAAKTECVKNTTTSGDTKTCDAGKYLNSSTDECTTCPKGYYCKNSKITACPNGYTTNEEGATSDDKCVKDGTTSNDDVKTCDNGKYLNSSTNECTTCPKGYYCKNSVITACSVGYTTKSTGATTSSDCSECDNGYKMNSNNVCEKSDEESKCDYDSTLECSNVTHYLCSQSSDSCYYPDSSLGCDAGYVANSDKTQCVINNGNNSGNSGNNGNVDNNPQTGENTENMIGVMMLGAICYLFYYFKNMRKD